MFTTMLAGSSVYTVKCEDIESFGVLNGIEELPGAISALRGTMPYRNSFIPVVDLRQLFGQPSLRSERRDLAKTLVDREKDHIDWIDDLTRCVSTGALFQKTTDPTKCAFGQWYYSFHSNDEQLARELKSFEIPHAEIHKLGITVIEQTKKGDTQAALRMIQHAREGTLASLLKQFARVRALLTDELREVVAIISYGEKRMAILVDSILDILQDNELELFPTQIDMPSAFYHSSYQIAKSMEGLGQKNRTAHLLSVPAIFDHFHVLTSKEHQLQKLMAQMEMS